MTMNDPAPALKRIAQFESRLQKRVYEPNAIIFIAGHRGDEAYIVRRGEVQIFTENDEGKRTVLSIIVAGQLFGELALMNEHLRTANARTQTGCELLVVDPKQIEALLENTSPFIRFWIEHLVGRVIDLTRRMK
jgi:CRP-like cAMP-binding protein